MNHEVISQAPQNRLNIHEIGNRVIACSAGGAGLGAVVGAEIFAAKGVLPAAIGALAGAGLGLRFGFSERGQKVK